MMCPLCVLYIGVYGYLQYFCVSAIPSESRDTRHVTMLFPKLAPSHVRLS